MKKLYAIIMVLVMALIFAGCQKTPELTYEKVDYSMIVGDEENLVPTIKNLEGTDLVNYTVNDPAVASVVNGVLKALKEGTTTVTASLKGYENITATLNVTVNKIAVNTITISGANSVRLGESTTLTASVDPNNATYIDTLEWSSSKPNVAMVDNNGVVTSKGVGTTTITVTVDGKSSDFEFTVLKPLTTKVVIDYNNKMIIGDEQELSVTVEPEYAEESVKWESSDETVATVDANGKVKALAAGEVTIKAIVEDEGKLESTAVITVVAPEVAKVEVSAEKQKLSAGETLDVTVVVTPAEANQAVTWTSSDETVATVDANGKVTAIASGKAEITATAENGRSASVEISVVEYYKRIILVDDDYQAGQEFVEDGSEYAVGINAFNNIDDAVKAVQTGGRIIVKAGSYAGNVTVDKAVTILGPNANVNPNKDTRGEEAVVTGVITLKNVTKVVINGLAFTGASQIINDSVDPVNDITLSNLNVYDKGEATSTWTDSAKDYNLTSFISIVAPSSGLSSKIVIKDNKFNLKEGAVKIGRAQNVTISGNSFTNFERDAVRIEGGYNAGTFTITKNSFVNDQLQGYNGVYFSSYGAESTTMEIYITENTFKNIGSTSATYTGAVSAKSYQEKGAVWSVENNVFENCVNYLKIRNNATEANHTGYPWSFAAKNNKFIGVPTGVYFNCRVTSGDNDSTAPALAVFDANLFLDADGTTVVAPAADKLLNVKSNTNAFKSMLEYEMYTLGIEDEIHIVVNGLWASEEAGKEVEFSGMKFTLGTDAFATLEEALAAATENQGIYLFPGTYTGTFTIDTNGLKLYGPNAGVNPNTSVRENEAVLENALIYLADGLDGLKLQGLKFTQKSQILFYDEVTVSKVVTKHCLFESTVPSGANGIFMGFDNQSSKYGVAVDFEFYNNRFETTTNNPRNLLFGEVQNLLVDGNYFATPGTDYCDLIKITHMKGEIIIKNNEFVNCGQDGLFIGITTNTATKVDIINNIFNNAGTKPDYGNSIDIRNASQAGAVYNIKYNTFVNYPADSVVVRFNKATAASIVNINYNKFLSSGKTYIEVDKANTTLDIENNYFADEAYTGKISGLTPTNVYANEADVEAYPEAPTVALKEITITSDPGALYQLDQYQIEYMVTPAAATNKKVKFSVSDEKLATISETGVLTCIKPGFVTVYVTSAADNTIEAEMEIEIKSQKRIDIKFEGETILEKGGKASLEATIVAGSSDDLVVWSSSDTKVLTVDESGQVVAVAAGTAVITGKLSTNENIKVEIEFTVVDEVEALDELLQKLVKYHNSKVLYQEVTSTGYQFVYDVVTYGSVNLYDFEPLTIDESIQTAIGDNRPGTKKKSTQYIVVHDTASSASTATAKAHASYVQNGGGGTSWSYSVGNDGIYHQMPDDEISYHAGDGRTREFAIEDTGVKATDVTTAPTITFDDEGYFAVNGQSTKLRPYKIVNDVESIDTAVYTTSQINDEGIFWTIGENGNYYLGKTWYSSTYKYVGNYGGNLNSIGMETMVNQGSNLELTWHRAAKLSAHLCIEHNLTTDRIKGHHFFSGKNCPQTLRENALYGRFHEMCDAEYDIQKNYSDYTIKMESHDPEILDNKGMIIKAPLTTTTVSYTITVTKGSESKSITLHSIVEGSLSVPVKNYTSLY